MVWMSSDDTKVAKSKDGDRMETEFGPTSLIFRARGTAAAARYGEMGTAARSVEARIKRG